MQGPTEAHLFGPAPWIALELAAGVFVRPRVPGALVLDTSGAVDPTGEWMYSVLDPHDSEGRLSVWHLAEPERVVGGRTMVESPELGPDGRRLAWVEAGYPQTLHVLDLGTRRERVFPTGPASSQIRFSPHGAGMAWVRSAEGDEAVVLWTGSGDPTTFPAAEPADFRVSDAGAVVIASKDAVLVGMTSGAVQRFAAKTKSVAIDPEASRIAWVDEHGVEVADLRTGNRWHIARGRRSIDGRVPRDGGDGPAEIEALSRSDIDVRFGSDVGALLRYPIRGGPFRIVDEWSPAADVHVCDRAMDLCRRAGIRCGDAEADERACENVHWTSRGPVLWTPGGAWLADPTTGERTHALERSAGMAITTEGNSPWIVGATSDMVRIWDAADGALVWSGGRTWCRQGVRLLPADTE